MAPLFRRSWRTDNLSRLQFPRLMTLPPKGRVKRPMLDRGVIQRIGEGQLEIQHEAIPGFMGAMRMTFSISEEAMNDSLEVGDEIIFKIAAHPEHGYQIFSVDAVAAE